jgi:hypothetical protein
MTQPPGNYGQPGNYGDPYGQPSGPPGGGGYGDPYGQPGYPDPYGQPSGPPSGYGSPPVGYGGAGYPPAGMPPAFPPPPAPRKSRTGLVIGLVAGVLVLLLCGGGALYYVIAGGGSTTAVVEGFLKEAFTNRDLDAAKQYVCAKETGNMQRDFPYPDQAKISVSWSKIRETENNGSNAEVAVDMAVKAELSGQSTEVKATWTFQLVNEGGWKVCDVDTGDNDGS